MALIAIRKWVSPSDQSDILLDEAGKVVLLDPTTYPQTLASVVHNVTISDVDFPGGAFTLAGLLKSTSNYPNTPPIDGLHGTAWLTDALVPNRYYYWYTIYNNPHTYTWRVEYDYLRFHLAASGNPYWEVHMRASKVTYPGLTTSASVAWHARKTCVAPDFSVYGDYSLVSGTLTHQPSGQTVWGTSNGWGISVSA